MIPNFINSAAPSPFPPVVDPREDQDQHDHDHHHHQHLLHHQLLLPPNYQTPSSSSSSVSYSVFFNSPHQDQPDHHHFRIDQMHHEQPQREDALDHVPYAGSHDPEKKPNKGLKISLWKNTENDHGDQENPVKWMSSKMRLMQKMKKKPDIVSKPEDQKPQQHPPSSSSLETDHFGSNSSSHNTNSTPFRVCADCNTTKTPLWRSGPKGPRSLCNACGIRQRKARRAMAAAAAAAANGSSQHFETTAAPVKMKVQNKEKMKNNIGQTTPFKKRSKMMVAAKASSHAQQQKKDNVFEDFLVKLSQNLAFHRVFPQDEKEAAILLMALSCGLVHG